MQVKTLTQKILTASEGHYLTNGETFGTVVVLPDTEDVSKWKEITEEEYNELNTETEI